MSHIRTRRVSGRQLDVLWEFLNSNRDIATAYNRSLQVKEYSRRKWTMISETLNAQGDGAHKEWNEWSKYWVDYKAKLKKRMSAFRLAQSATGGGPSQEQPLSDIDKKFLQILREDFGQGLPGIRVEPFLENPRSTASIEDSPESIPILISEALILDSPALPHLQQVSSLHPIPEEPLQEPRREILQPNIADPAPPSSPRSPPRSPQPMPAAAARSPRRRRRRRQDLPMSMEAARRSLVESARIRAEAAMRSSLALENIHNTLLRIERTIHDAFPRAAE